MKKLCAIGEALIDFIPSQKGVCLKDVVSFQRTAGGAPANVAAAVARLGGSSKVITQLGKDAFGDFLVATMQAMGLIRVIFNAVKKEIRHLLLFR